LKDWHHYGQAFLVDSLLCVQHLDEPSNKRLYNLLFALEEGCLLLPEDVAEEELACEVLFAQGRQLAHPFEHSLHQAVVSFFEPIAKKQDLSAQLQINYAD
jgi:hypothetical protein